MKVKRSKSSNILVPDKTLEMPDRSLITSGNAFDYLLSLKSSGRTPAARVDDLDAIGKSAASTITAMNVDSEIDIAKTIRELMDSKVVVPKDMKIDDGDLPMAKNFYEWVTQDRFGTIGDERPFIEQLIWGLVVFNDYCVAKGSHVYSSLGLLKIEDLLRNPTKTGLNPFATSVVTDSGIKPTSHGGMTSKRRKCLRVTYASGHSVIVTPDHQIRKLKSDYTLDWVRADKLAIGDFGVMPFGANLWPSKPAELLAGFDHSAHHNAKQFTPLKVVTSELARLTGYIIADGFMNKNTIGFVNTDRAVVDDFIHCCESVFGHTPKRECKTKGSSKISKTPFENAFLHGSNFVAWMRHIGFRGTKSHNKVIPEFIMRSEKTVVADCMRAIFDCDGFVDRERVGISLTSEKLVKQIQLLMQNIGVYGAFRKQKEKDFARFGADLHECRPMFSWVSRHAPSMQRYADCIGSIHEEKAENLRNLRAAPTASNSNNGTAQPGVIPFCKETYAYAKTLKTDYHDKGLTYTKHGRRDFAVASELLADAEFISYFEKKDSKFLKRLTKMATSNFAFSKVVRVEDAGTHEVYDLTVPGVENFVCEGIVVHNCPKCSDMDWLLHEHKVDDTYTKLERKVAIFENGKCPHCKLGRAKAVRKGMMPYYNELAVNAGQRCVIDSTPVITQHGMLHIAEVFPDAPEGFTDFEFDVFNGEEFETTSHYFRATPEPVYRAMTSLGFSVCGTTDHPILTKEGFVKIGELKLTEKLDVVYGSRVFGPKSYPNAYASGLNFRDAAVSLNLRCSNVEDVTDFLRGVFALTPRKAFINMVVLRDISALLLNAGYPHKIDGPSIVFSTVEHENLLNKVWRSGVIEDKITTVISAGVQATYDFTLPKTHQFVTGGIISHNSGKSHTVGTYLAPYHLHRLLKLQKPAQFYGLSRTTMLQGTFAALTYTQAKDTLWTPFYGALTESRWFCLVGSSGITMADGSKKQIKDVVAGDSVKTYEGTNEVVNVFDNGVKSCKKITLHGGQELEGTDGHKVRCLSPCGTTLVWKNIGDLTEDDYVVTES